MIIREEHVNRILENFYMNDDDCWMSEGFPTIRGYPFLHDYRDDDGFQPRHKICRYIWSLMREKELSEEQCLFHHCNNKLCFNPDHMEVMNESECAKATHRDAGHVVFDDGYPQVCMRGHTLNSDRDCYIKYNKRLDRVMKSCYECKRIRSKEFSERRRLGLVKKRPPQI